MLSHLIPATRWGFLTALSLLILSCQTTNPAIYYQDVLETRSKVELAEVENNKALIGKVLQPNYHTLEGRYVDGLEKVTLSQQEMYRVLDSLYLDHDGRLGKEGCLLLLSEDGRQLYFPNSSVSPLQVSVLEPSVYEERLHYNQEQKVLAEKREREIQEQAQRDIKAAREREQVAKQKEKLEGEKRLLETRKEMLQKVNDNKKYVGKNIWSLDSRITGSKKSTKGYRPIKIHERLKIIGSEIIPSFTGVGDQAALLLRDSKGEEFYITAISFNESSFATRNPYPESWGNKNIELIKSGKVAIGMTQQQVKMAWGEPRSTNSTIHKYGTHEQWVYGNGYYVYFESDRVTSIQTSQ